MVNITQPQRAGGRGEPGRSHRTALRPAVGYLRASSFMWQFLYFLPLPHGHGSFRPTFAPTFRIGSGFFASPPVFVLCSAASACAERAWAAEIADCCVARA